MNFVYTHKNDQIFPVPAAIDCLNSYIETKIPIELEGVAIGRWLGYEGGARMNEISILTKRPQRYLPCSRCLRTRKQAFIRYWILNFQASVSKE